MLKEEMAALLQKLTCSLDTGCLQGCRKLTAPGPPARMIPQLWWPEELPDQA